MAEVIAAPPRGGAAAEAPGILTGQHVFLAEDDAATRIALAAVCRRLGAAEVTAFDGGHAMLERLQAGGPHPDLILLDLSMEQGDGVQALRGLAQLGVRAGLLLASSAPERVQQATERLALGLGLSVHGRIAKPPTREALVAALRRGARRQDGAAARHPDELPPAALADAIAAGRLLPFYQPQMDLASGRIVAAEALARLDHPTFGLLPAARFLPVAAAAGMNGRIAESMIGAVIGDLATLARLGVATRLSVNLTVGDLSRPALPDTLVRRLEQTGVPPDRLVIELTETEAIAELDQVLEVCARLRLAGIGLALDDFGTGHASLQTLRDLPFSELKIDRGFVCGAATESGVLPFLESSVALARQLGLDVVAEGVETQAEVALVRLLGVNRVQGWAIGRPMPFAQLRALLASDEPRPVSPR
jgi:EAL domain-containing protein (putative c-di-GMP-specific phosphodiesterase class I)/CheY-like chemotaxis protein